MQTLHEILAREDERRNLRVGAYVILATIALVTIAVIISEDFGGFGQSPVTAKPPPAATDVVE